MAPDIALGKLTELAPACRVLDPMAGSGTVLRQAISLGHQAIGFDLDPLAVLMTRVWTAPVDDRLIVDLAQRALALADILEIGSTRLSWIDDDAETLAFVNFWFAEPQRNELRRLAHAFYQLSAEATSSDEQLALDVLKIAFSRLIITKDKGASLARDVSHSRPHKVAETNDFAVRAMFERSINTVRKRLADAPPLGDAEIDLGDARSLTSLADESIDAVLTSPPYLNAIDYMRGHRLSLIWFGHRLAELRAIRSNSIGSERSPDILIGHAELAMIRAAMGELDSLPAKFSRVVDRYVQDIHHMICEVARVLKTGGHATFVVGNSCLRGVFIRNSAAITTAASFVGLSLAEETDRPLPSNSRYLPMTSTTLGKRMRTETVLSFVRYS